MAFVGKAFKWLFLLVGFLVVAIIAIAILAAAFAGGGGQGASSEPVVDEAGAAASSDNSGDSVASGDSAPADDTADAIVRITGNTSYSGDIMTDSGSKTVQGSGPQDYPAKVDTGMMSMDYLSASFMKDGMDSGTLGVQILVDGEVVKQTSTSAEMGMAMVDWYPSDG